MRKAAQSEPFCPGTQHRGYLWIRYCLLRGFFSPGVCLGVGAGGMMSKVQEGWMVPSRAS